MASNSSENTHNPSDKRAGMVTDSDQAVAVVRQKISQLYNEEPNAKEEILESEAATSSQRSKHQKFMHDLSTSGKSLAEIQTAWHNYYVGLPDKEKHEVWQEFYSEHSKTQAIHHTNSSELTQNQGNKVKSQHPGHIVTDIPNTDERSVAEVKTALEHKITRRRPSKKAHFHSLLFGLSLGLVSIIILLFGFFNERFIAPFITPSKIVSSTPIVIDPASAAVGTEPKIIIPKINVEIPVVYDQPSIAEHDIQKSLEEGVVHYATTSNPGEKGNGVIFGHSSNNILNHGKYKFAFVLLKQLEPGDVFYLQKDGKRYVYKVGDKRIVKPSDVSILTTKTDQSTMTLITCDPPGTSLNRLLVIGQQVSPDPSKNIASNSAKNVSQSQPTVIPSNAPSLWQRIKDWFTS